MEPTTDRVADRYTGRRVLVNTGALAGSSLWRIAVSFVLQIVIARALSLPALGQYTVALAYLNVCQVLSELGLQTLLVRDLAQTPTQRRGYFRIALLTQMGASLLIWGALWGLTQLLPFGPTTGRALLLVGATLPFYAITSVCQTLFQSSERMELVMGVEVAINTLIVALSLLLLWMGYSILALVAVLIATQALSALLCLALLAYSRLLAQPQEPVPWQPVALWRRAMPFYGLALSDVLLNRLDILLLGAFGGATLTGIYSAAYNVVRILVKLVQSFWQALYPTFSRLRSGQPTQYNRLAALSVRFGLVALLLAAAAGTGVAATLMHLVYGAESVDAVPSFQLLLWMAPAFLLETYATLTFMVERQPLNSLLITGVHLAAMSVALPLLTFTFGAEGAAAAAVVASFAGATGGLLLLRRRGILPKLPSLGALLMATGLAAVTGLFLPLPWFLRGGASVVLYVVVLWSTRVITSADLRLLYQSAVRPKAA